MPIASASISTIRLSGEYPVSWPFSFSRPSFSAAQAAAGLTGSRRIPSSSIRPTSVSLSLDFRADLGERGAELRVVLVGGGGPPRQLDPPGGAGEVVVEVD